MQCLSRSLLKRCQRAIGTGYSSLHATTGSTSFSLPQCHQLLPQRVLGVRGFASAESESESTTQNSNAASNSKNKRASVAQKKKGGDAQNKKGGDTDSKTPVKRSAPPNKNRIRRVRNNAGAPKNNNNNRTTGTTTTGSSNSNSNNNKNNSKHNRHKRRTQFGIATKRVLREVALFTESDSKYLVLPSTMNAAQRYVFARE